MIGSLGLPLHLQLLHRLDGRLPAARLRPGERGPRVPAHQDERPIVGWHDPNFGVRFDDYMEAIEAAVPPGRMRHIAESSLSLLAEPHLQRLRKNGFQAILPGIESWFDLGNKSKTRRTGHGEGGAGRGAREHDPALHPLHPDQLRAGPRHATRGRSRSSSPSGSSTWRRARSPPTRCSPRSAGPRRSTSSTSAPAACVPFPFTFLNNNHAMNVRPKNYAWPAFYDQLVDLSRYSFSWRAIRRRLGATEGAIPKWMNVVRAMSSEGWGRIEYHSTIRRLLDEDRERARLHGGRDRPAAGLLRPADRARSRPAVPAPAGRAA